MATKKTSGRSKASAKKATSKKASSTKKKATMKPAKKKVAKKPTAKSVKKKTAKKPIAKQAKKKATTKPAKKKVVKKPTAKSAKKKVLKKPIAKAPKKKAAKKTVSKAPARKAAKKAARVAAKPVEPVEEAPRKPVKLKMDKQTKAQFVGMLMTLRARFSGQIAALTDDSLKRHDSVNSEEDGTDAFERQFALNLASSEHERLMQIEEALTRVDDGTYGVCQSCDKLIEVPRLKALPFTTMCVTCKSEAEKRNPARSRKF